MLKFVFAACLLFAFNAAFAQKKSVAILPSDGVLSQEEMEALTDRVHKAAISALPEAYFTILRQEVVIKRLGGAESYVKECMEGTCIVDLGKKAQADYVAKASVGKLGGKLRLKIELYNVETEGSIDLFDEDFKDFLPMRKAVDEHIPGMFKKISGAAAPAVPAPPAIPAAPAVPAAPLLSSVEFITDPPYAALMFNDEPYEECLAAPCKIELAKGMYNVSALMNPSRADTAIEVAQNSQRVFIKLKPSVFAVSFITEPPYAALMFNGMQYDKCLKAPCKIELAKGAYNISAIFEKNEKVDTAIYVSEGNQIVDIKLPRAEYAPKIDSLPKEKSFFTLGIRGGMNMSHFYATYSSSNTGESDGTYESVPGFQVGLVFDFALSKRFYLQPGIMYIQKGAADNRDYVYGSSFSIASNYVEIPLLLSLKLSNFRLNAGPYIGFSGGSSSGGESIEVIGGGTEHMVEENKAFDFGISLGLGFDMGRFYVGMFYDWGLWNSYYERYFGGAYYNAQYGLRELHAYNRTLGFNFGVNL